MINTIITIVFTTIVLISIKSCSDNEDIQRESRYNSRGEKYIHKYNSEQMDEIIHELKVLNKKMGNKND
jgi:uncharacterized lipoprotein YehR (DUF1307 family)